MSARKSITFSNEMENGNNHTTFDHIHVGTYSCCGMEDGEPKTNQDYAAMAHPFAKTLGSALFCVFDGHGRKGHDVSQEALYSMYYELEQNVGSLLDAPGNAIAEAFEAVQQHLKLMAVPEAGREKDPLTVDARESGACAVIPFLKGRDLWVGGVGDCRAVLGTRQDGVLLSVELTTDHKVDLPSEQQRIEASGGWVKPAEADEDGTFLPARLYRYKGVPGGPAPKGGPGLCVARAFGDLTACSIGLISCPELCNHTLVDEDEYLILASDGVWEFIENDEALQIVSQMHRLGKSADEACKILIAKAALCWRHFEGDYRDDITAVVIYLSPVVEALEVERDGVLG